MKMLALYLLAGLVAIAALAYAAGAMLPEDHVATVASDYSAAPEALWAVITDPPRFMEWRTGLKKVDIQGDRITEHASYGAMAYRFVNSAAPRTIATESLNGKELGFAGSWTFEIAPTGQGARLTITERGKVFSPLFRVMSRYVFGHEGTMRQYHADLAKRLARQR